MARVVDLVAAAGAPLVLSAADKRAIRTCSAEPTVIAAAIAAAARGEWGDEWLQQNLSARLVIQRLSGFLASRKSANDQVERRGGPPHRSSSDKGLGPAKTAYAWDPWGPGGPPISAVDREGAAGEAPL
ncbi:MAG: hypothetical protein JO020_29925 [Chloroflexi bacterium]|nr:hypothetical protein [Chloroflexota bacterium]MBV9898395.1 hypothetical protein [Chloroflexota bacterium]